LQEIARSVPAMCPQSVDLVVAHFGGTLFDIHMCDMTRFHVTLLIGQVLAEKYPQGVDLVIEHVGGKLFDTALLHLAPKVCVP